VLLKNVGQTKWFRRTSPCRPSTRSRTSCQILTSPADLHHDSLHYYCTVTYAIWHTLHLPHSKKGKEEYLYNAFYILCISQSAQAWITQFYLQIHHACLSFVHVHQMAPPLTEVREIQLQLTTHLSTRKRWKAEMDW